MDSQISYLTRELKNLTLRKRPNLEKKYFIDKETRNQIKKLQHITIGLIPFQSKRNPIYNSKKEFFINHTHILTKNKKMIQLTTPNKKCYLKLIKKYLESNLKIKLDLTRINKILEIEKSKVFLFTVDLTGFEIISQSSNDLLDKIQDDILLEGINQHNIFSSKVCTLEDEEYYSYRRGDNGRIYSAIGFKK